jgi:hypothetical protein
MAFTPFRELNKSPVREGVSFAFSVEDSPLRYSPRGVCDGEIWRGFKGVEEWRLEEEVRKRRMEVMKEEGIQEVIVGA